MKNDSVNYNYHLKINYRNLRLDKKISPRCHCNHCHKKYVWNAKDITIIDQIYQVNTNRWSVQCFLILYRTSNQNVCVQLSFYVSFATFDFKVRINRRDKSPVQLFLRINCKNELYCQNEDQLCLSSLTHSTAVTWYSCHFIPCITNIRIELCVPIYFWRDYEFWINNFLSS